MRGWPANLIGSGAILAVIIAISTGLPMIAERLSDRAPVPEGTRLEIKDDAVTVAAPADAAEDTAESSPQNGRLVLEVRGIRYAFRAAAYHGNLRDAAERLRAKIAELPDYQLSGETRPVSTDQGANGVTGRFNSANSDGYFAVFVHNGMVVEAVAHGAGLHLDDRLKRVRETVATIRIGGSP